MSKKLNPTKLTYENKINYVKELKSLGDLTDTEIRTQIRHIFSLKKSAGNELFRKIFAPIPFGFALSNSDGGEVVAQLNSRLSNFAALRIETKGKIKKGDAVALTKDGKVYSIKSPNGSKINVAKNPQNPIKGNTVWTEEQEYKEGDKVYLSGVGEGKIIKPAAMKIDGDKAVVESDQVKTLEELVKFGNIDLEEWEVVKFATTHWNGKIGVRGEFKRKVTQDIKQIIDNLKADLISHSPVVKKYSYKAVKEGKLLVIGIMDAHLGRLSSKGEVNHNYDIKIAREIYLKTLYDLVDKAKKQGDIEKILYIIGNDYLTVDGESLQTTAGTDQDTDGRFPRIFREGRKLLVETIEILSQIAQVDVVTVFGNHERASMFHLGDALQCWFRNNENINIDNTEKLRKYYVWKDTVIATTHGDTIKHDKLVTMGLVEFGEQWGKAKRRFWLLGHTHHLKCVNLQGTELWTFPSICGSDGYHQANGYVGSTRNGLAMIFSKDNLEAVFQSQPVEDKDYQ